MKLVNYPYKQEEAFIIFEYQPGLNSIYVHFEELLPSLKAEVGSLEGKHILCEGEDGYWDLAVPITEGEAIIYPLSALSLAEAKVKFGELTAKGFYPHLR